MENNGPDGVELLNSSTVNVLDDTVHEEYKVEDALLSEVKKMETSDGKPIQNC